MRGVVLDNCLEQSGKVLTVLPSNFEPVPVVIPIAVTALKALLTPESHTQSNKAFLGFPFQENFDMLKQMDFEWVGDSKELILLIECLDLLKIVILELNTKAATDNLNVSILVKDHDHERFPKRYNI